MKHDDLKGLIANLPPYPGILGRDRYFNSVVLITLFERDRELFFVFEKRAAHIRQGGEISFPGGAYEKELDESYRDTALRETREELCVPADRIESLGQLATLINMAGTELEGFFGLLSIPELSSLAPNPQEVERVFAIPVSFFQHTKPEVYHARVEVQPHFFDENGNQVVLLPSRELGLPSRYLKPWGGKEHVIHLYRHGGEIIWGITAELVREFISRIPSGGGDTGG